MAGQCLLSISRRRKGKRRWKRRRRKRERRRRRRKRKGRRKGRSKGRNEERCSFLSDLSLHECGQANKNTRLWRLLEPTLLGQDNLWREPTRCSHRGSLSHISLHPCPHPNPNTHRRISLYVNVFPGCSWPVP